MYKGITLIALMTGLLLSRRIASCADFAYLATFDAYGNGVLGVVNLDTGQFTAIPSQQTQPYLDGLAELNGVLYGYGRGNFYEIDPTNASYTVVGSPGALWACGSTKTGIFALDQSQNSNLYSIDPTTGSSTLIGPTGIDLTYSDAGATTGGLSVGADTLYLNVSTLDTLVSQVYSINTQTGSATLLSTIMDNVCLKNIVLVGNNLYAASGYCTAGSEIFTLDPTNYTTTFVANASGYNDLNGIAPAPGPICDSTYNGTFKGNLAISSGRVCIINGTVTGNVTQSGGSLTTSSASIGGNLQITGGGTFSIETGTTINGSLQIQNIPPGSAQNQICGTTIDGDLQFHNNGTALEIGQVSASCASNNVGGNLQVNNNTATVQIVGNTVNSNLQCQNNTSITGGANSAKAKQGQCASF